MTITIDGTSGIASVDGSAGSPSVRGSDANSGILYDSDTVAISTAGSERVRVSSGGKLLVGTTTDAPYGTRYLTVGDTSIDDVCLEIRSSSTTGRLYFTDSSSSGVGAYQGELTFDHNSGANRMHTKIAGTTKISVTTDGLTFNGDTAATNALSDYEEGTYTPVLSGTDGWTASASDAEASYVKIGKVCIVAIRYASSSLSGIGGSSGLRVNIPFTSKSAGSNVGQMSISEWSIGSSSISWMGAKVNNNEAFARFQYHNGNNNNTNDLTKDSANDSMNFRGTITYITS